MRTINLGAINKNNIPYFVFVHSLKVALLLHIDYLKIFFILDFYEIIASIRRTQVLRNRRVCSL